MSTSPAILNQRAPQGLVAAMGTAGVLVQRRRGPGLPGEGRV